MQSFKTILSRKCKALCALVQRMLDLAEWFSSLPFLPFHERALLSGFLTPERSA